VTNPSRGKRARKSPVERRIDVHCRAVLASEGTARWTALKGRAERTIRAFRMNGSGSPKDSESPTTALCNRGIFYFLLFFEFYVFPVRKDGKRSMIVSILGSRACRCIF
jgi:hypothetical protein